MAPGEALVNNGHRVYDLERSVNRAIEDANIVGLRELREEIMSILVRRDLGPMESIMFPILYRCVQRIDQFLGDFVGVALPLAQIDAPLAPIEEEEEEEDPIQIAMHTPLHDEAEVQAEIDEARRTLSQDIISRLSADLDALFDERRANHLPASIAMNTRRQALNDAEYYIRNEIFHQHLQERERLEEDRMIEEQDWQIAEQDRQIAELDVQDEDGEYYDQQVEEGAEHPEGTDESVLVSFL